NEITRIAENDDLHGRHGDGSGRLPTGRERRRGRAWNDLAARRHHRPDHVRRTQAPDEGEAGAGGGTLIAAQGAEPDRLDPHLTSAYASFQILENVYDTLVQPGDDLSMEPALAESWDISDDQL